MDEPQGWDNVTDVERQLRIIRGEPVEYFEQQVKRFTTLKEQFVAMQEFHAAAVARDAADAFRKMLGKE